MIFSLNGKLIYKDDASLVVECGGVGYKCAASLPTLADMPRLGGDVFVYTHMAVREDAVDLFAFSTTEELNTFRLLTGVNGVGPKVGIAILSALPPAKIALAVAGGDSKALTTAQGVGPKLAQRIVLELKDKFKGVAGSVDEITAAGNATAGTNTAEAVSALTALGYSQSEAALAVGKLDPQLSVEDLIRGALKQMARG